MTEALRAPFTHYRLYGNRPLTKARSDPASFAAHLRAYSARGIQTEFVGPAWRIAGEIAPHEIHSFFRLPPSVRVRHIGPRLDERRSARLLRSSLAIPAATAGALSGDGLHYHKDSLMAIASRRYPGVHLLAVVGPPRTAVDRLALRVVDGVVANTPALAEWYTGTWPSLAGRVVGIRGSFDPSLTSWGRGDRATARLTVGVQHGRRVVLYSGKVFAGSSELRMIADACSGLSVALVVVGGTDAARQWLESICPRDVQLLSFPLVPPADLASYFAAADVLVSYYPSDTLGLAWVDSGKIYPYLGSGRPVVAAAHAAMADLLVHGENAELACPDDPDSLRASLRRVLDEPEYARRLAAAGRVTAAAHTIGLKVNRILEFADGLRHAPAPRRRIAVRPLASAGKARAS